MRKDSGHLSDHEQPGNPLAGSEDSYRLLVESSPDAISVLRAGKFLYANAAAAKLFGYGSPEELTGKSLLEFIHADGRDAVGERMRQVEQEGRPAEHLEGKVRRADGQGIDVEMTFVPVAVQGQAAIQGIIRDVTESRRTADALKESEEYYRDLVEHSRDLMCTHDLQGRILSVNAAAVKISGFDASVFLGRSIRDFLAPDVRHLFDDYLARIQRDGYAEGLMHVVNRAGERRVWKYYNTLRTEGVPTPIVRGLAHDVTELKRAEEEIQKLNESLEQRITELRTLLDVIPIGIGISADPECRDIQVNPYFARALGISPDENASMSAPEGERPTNFKVFRDGRELAAHELPMQYAAANGVTVMDVEVDVVHSDGRVVNLLECAAPLFDERGKVRGVVGAFLDITERKRAEEALRQSEKEYRELFENAHDAIIIFDPEGEIVLEVNRRACEVYGFSRSEFIGMSLEAISKDPDRNRGRIRETLDSDSCHHFETVQYRKGGSEMHLEINAAAVSYRGKPAILSINRDITERKRAEKEREQLLALERIARAEAEAASRTKDEFLATVSHELRTPLNAIQGWAQILCSGNPDPMTLAQGLNAIKRNAKSQAQLIEDILDVSRITSGKLHLHVRPTDLVSVIKAAIDTVRPAADAKDIKIQMIVDASIGAALADPERLQQVVWNLLSNAVKFTPNDGQVEIRLERIEGCAQITVKDTGEGVDREFLPHIFDRFRQADASTTRRHGGLGLGLAIVRHLVEMHGGAVEADSPGRGQGATFTVRLPLKGAATSMTPQAGSLDSQAISRGAAAARQDFPKVEGLRVLVVDDDVETLSMISAMLEPHGVEVVTSASVAAAFASLRQRRPDVLVSDIAMPEEDGYALIRKVRSLDPQEGGDVPAVALTAHVRIEDRARALSAGYEMFVPKPVDVTELLSAIATLTGRAEKNLPIN
ncbi:MAG TPA: PAS domain S-box protein [Blastocatellia bacterium]|nr:PAS domain S-box protein [Blastocatellia bacterium]